MRTLSDVRSRMLALPEADRSGPASMFPKVIELYVMARIEGTDPDADGDLLLLQWGTNDWGHGLHFEVDLTRQVSLAGPDEDDAEIAQLSCKFVYAPAARLAELDSGSQWCSSVDDALEFWDLVIEHQAVKAVADLTPHELQVVVRSVG